MSFGELNDASNDTLIVAAALLSLIGAGQRSVRNRAPPASGRRSTRTAGQPTGWFLIRDRDGVYEGLIVRMYLQPGEEPDVVCDRCNDDRHNKPWLGLDIIRGMKRDGLNYNDGSILDPRYGKSTAPR